MKTEIKRLHRAKGYLCFAQVAPAQEAEMRVARAFTQLWEIDMRIEGTKPERALYTRVNEKTAACVKLLEDINCENTYTNSDELYARLHVVIKKIDAITEEIRDFELRCRKDLTLGESK